MQPPEKVPARSSSERACQPGLPGRGWAILLALSPPWACPHVTSMQFQPVHSMLVFKMNYHRIKKLPSQLGNYFEIPLSPQLKCVSLSMTQGCLIMVQGLHFTTGSIWTCGYIICLVTLYVLAHLYSYCFFILIQIRFETRLIEDFPLTLQGYWMVIMWCHFIRSCVFVFQNALNLRVV